MHDKQILSRQQVIKTGALKSPSVWLATWFFSGFLRPAPGTWGTIAGAAALCFLYGLTDTYLSILVAIAVLSFAGWWAAEEFGKRTGVHDADMVVIDEVAGVAIALLFAFPSPLLVIVAVTLFRFFDIQKFGPIGWLDKNLKGGWGVMADDLLAGLITCLIVGGLHLAGIG